MLYPYPKAPTRVDISDLLNNTFWEQVRLVSADPGIQLDLTQALRYADKDHHRFVLVPHLTDIVPQHVLDDYSIVLDETMNRLDPSVDYRIFFEDTFLHILCSYRLVD